MTLRVLDILKAAGAELDYEVYNVGEAEWKKNGALILYYLAVYAMASIQIYL